MRVMKWIGEPGAALTFSMVWAEDVKLVRMSRMPESKILRKVQPAYPPDAVGSPYSRRGEGRA